MLKTLLIKNYALIEHLQLSPSKELNIITGETGAGKSIMLGAIGLLLGNRADTKALFDKEQKCIIEAAFEIGGYNLETIFEEADIDYETLCVIRREINPAGKSRVFINDTPSTLENVKLIASRLIDIHSQHETLLLGSLNFQIAFVDAYAKNGKILNDYKLIFKEHSVLSQQYQLLITEAEEAKKQEDYNKFLLHEFTSIDLKEHEQEELEKELKILESAEEIKLRLHFIVQKMSSGEEGIISNLQLAEKNAGILKQFGVPYSELYERVRSVLLELKDLAFEFEKEEEGVESGYVKIETIKERLSEIYTLQKKHGVHTVAELLSIKENLEKKVSFVMDMENNLSQLKVHLEQKNKELVKIAELISKSRLDVRPKVKSELERLLKEVGMPNATLEIRQNSVPLSINGGDLITILFSANKGVAPQDLKTVGSGGEFSRLMLCIKYLLADKTYMPTIIFDEIDTGISGEIAIKVGRMMRHMAHNHQVIAISHLPQIAAQGSSHYFVYKDNSKTRTTSKIRILSEEERIFEIAQMIGGEKPSAIALTNAKELLSLN